MLRLISASCIVALTCAFLAQPAQAQPAPYDTVGIGFGVAGTDTLGVRRASLRGWHDEVDAFLLDRTRSYGGYDYDRGVFRRITLEMDTEYDIDRTTYGYSPADDYGFYRQDHAIRGYIGSITTIDFMNVNLLRHKVGFGERHTALLRVRLRDDLQATQSFLEVGYRYRIARGHRLGFRATIGSYKPDLDAGLVYEADLPGGGLAQIDVVWLDYINNIDFELGVDELFSDTTRIYRTTPRLMSGRVETPLFSIPGGTLRGEFYGGVQPSVTADFASQEFCRRELGAECDFEIETAADYQGALLEYATFLPARIQLTSGLMLTRTASDFRRASEPGHLSTADYATRQTDVRVTGYLLARRREVFADLWLGRQAYVDTQTGTDFGTPGLDAATVDQAFEYDEDVFTVDAQVRRVPSRKGGIIGLRYLRHDRDLASGLDPSRQPRGSVLRQLYRERFALLNHRASLLFGWQWTPGIYLLAAINYDLDFDEGISGGRDDGRRRYDGGTGRVVITW